jgi:hypothetical protein
MKNPAAKRLVRMKRILLQLARTFAVLVLMAAFTALVFGEGGPSLSGTPAGTPFEEVIRIAGWIAIFGAGVTYTVLNVYNAIRGKNVEQLKEALANYKELAESRKAQVAERDAQLKHCEAEKLRLETDNERLKERVLRQ